MEHGKAHAAEALLRQAALTVGQQKGVLDPDAVALRANLAFAIDAQKRYAETEPLYRLLLRDARKVFGAHHPYTLTIENNLAYVLNKLDRAV
ncbi:MAG TPA: tetratricopeptide repeat protein, partial [Rudaea sp.]|nr:tetratricopeptide repeat protein [Rudaea sp.]